MFGTDGRIIGTDETRILRSQEARFRVSSGCFPLTIAPAQGSGTDVVYICHNARVNSDSHSIAFLPPDDCPGDRSAVMVKYEVRPNVQEFQLARYYLEFVFRNWFSNCSPSNPAGISTVISFSFLRTTSGFVPLYASSAFLDAMKPELVHTGFPR